MLGDRPKREAASKFLPKFVVGNVGTRSEIRTKVGVLCLDVRSRHRVKHTQTSLAEPGKGVKISAKKSVIFKRARPQCGRQPGLGSDTGIRGFAVGEPARPRPGPHGVRRGRAPSRAVRARPWRRASGRGRAYAWARSETRRGTRPRQAETSLVLGYFIRFITYRRESVCESSGATEHRRQRQHAIPI